MPGLLISWGQLERLADQPLGGLKVFLFLGGPGLFQELPCSGGPQTQQSRLNIKENIVETLETEVRILQEEPRHHGLKLGGKILADFSDGNRLHAENVVHQRRGVGPVERMDTGEQFVKDQAV